MKHDRLLIVGESYMKPFVDASGHLELAQKLRIADVHTLVFPGSAVFQCAREIVDYLLEYPKPKTLVIWGLTFVSRFDILVSNYGENPHISSWASFNGDNFNAISPSEIIDYDKMLSAARALSGVRSLNYDRIVKEYLNAVITTSALIKQQGHDYIIYSQCGLECKEFPQRKYIEDDPGFLDLFSLAVNAWLQEQGVLPTREDQKNHPHLPLRLMHPESGKALVDKLCMILCCRYEELFGGME